MSSIQTHHRGSISQHSRSASQYISIGSDVEDVTDAELVKLVNDLKQQIKILTIENEILENVIMRVEPSLMHGVQQALEYATKKQMSSSLIVGSFVKSNTSRFGLGDSMTSPSRLLASPSRLIASPSKLLASPSRISTRKVESSAKMGGTVILGQGPKINILERSELVTTEMELVVKRLEKCRNKAAKDHALLTAQLEEIGIRVIDVDKATEAFNREVIVGGWDKIAKRIPAEAWIRYMNEWVKLSDKEIGKLRLRTSTLNTQYAKFKGQIRVKTELSESLRPVDFEKLEIENKVACGKIEKKMVQLAELKEMAGDANLNLVIHKKEMMEQDGYLKNIIDEIENKKRHTITLGRERVIIAAQAEAVQYQLDQLRKVRAAYEVPDIIEYVTVKSEVGELMQKIKMLENRYHIQQIALKSLNRQIAASMIQF